MYEISPDMLSHQSDQLKAFKEWNEMSFAGSIWQCSAAWGKGCLPGLFSCAVGIQGRLQGADCTHLCRSVLLEDY